MHSVYYLVETRKKTTIPLKTSPLWVESIWSLEAKEDTTDVMILSEQANESVQRCNWMNAENGENTCVNDPIPLGYIQFNSTTSRSKDLSVPILICFYQFFVGFFYRLIQHTSFVVLYWWNNFSTYFFPYFLFNFDARKTSQNRFQLQVYRKFCMFLQLLDFLFIIRV